MDIKNYHLFYLFTFFRSFLPLTAFMTPYLIEEKGLRNSQIYNGVHPTFFISSLLFTIIFPSVISYLSSNSLLYFIIIMEIGYLSLFLFMPHGQHIFACAAAICHSFSTAANSLGSKFILDNFIPKNTDTNDARIITATNTTMKKIPAVLSAILAQNIFFQANRNKPNVILSLISMAIPLFIIPLISNFNFISKKNLIFELFTGGFKNFIKIYNKDILFYSATSIITSTFTMGFAIYYQNIFYERKRNTTPSPTLLSIVNLISTPFSFFAKGYLYFYNMFQLNGESGTNEIKNMEMNKKYLYGYVDGASKILASIISMFFTNYVRSSNPIYNRYIIISVILLLISLTFAMGRVSSLFKTYILFIAVNMVIQAANDSIIADFRNLCRKNELSYSSFITFNLFLDSLIHITISYGTKFLGLSVSKKLYAYFIISIPLFCTAIYCMI